ncbi:hypothetical protein DPV78_007713 [Talaromyces pinophilus]|nr:hypothetical protein DPV78_007713 [Talaromyces pinophilus]
MLLKKGKKGGAWLMPRFDNNPDIRVYTALAIKELKALKKRYKNKANAVPIDIINDVVWSKLFINPIPKPEKSKDLSRIYYIYYIRSYDTRDYSILQEKDYTKYTNYIVENA